MRPYTSGIWSDIKLVCGLARYLVNRVSKVRCPVSDRISYLSEICSLPMNSIDIEEGFARVFGKGSKERVVPVGRHAILSVRNYLHGGRPFLTKEGTGSELFLSMRGKAISRKTVWVLVKQYAKKAGIEKARS